MEEHENILLASLIKHLPSGEIRTQQAAMIEFIDKCITQNMHGMINAGTGTGKTFGYLIPLLIKERRIVISTHNNSLVNQIYKNDLPFIQRIFKSTLDKNFTYSILQGTENYICKSCFDSLINESLFNDQQISDELEKKISAVFSDGNFTGLIADIKADIPDEIIDKIKVKQKCCIKTKCINFNNCPFIRSRNIAAKAQVVVTNHSLIAMDMLFKQQNAFHFFDRRDFIVCDEGHELENSLISAWSTELATNVLLKKEFNFRAIPKKYGLTDESKKFRSSLITNVNVLNDTISKQL
jgi:ATP-dependent DNA helicase DinG